MKIVPISRDLTSSADRILVPEPRRGVTRWHAHMAASVKPIGDSKHKNGTPIVPFAQKYPRHVPSNLPRKGRAVPKQPREALGEARPPNTSGGSNKACIRSPRQRLRVAIEGYSDGVILLSLN